MINRRDLIAILAAAAAPADYKLRFFSEDENRLIDELAEMIIPADERSPGARAAKVSLYIDLVVSSSEPRKQADWKTQLAAFDRAGSAPFLKLSANDRAALLHRLAKAESDPSSGAERFFAAMKRMTLAGYYTSEIGYRREFERKSPEMLAEFPGTCRDGRL